jgi:uncharacterized Zn finger protein
MGWYDWDYERPKPRRPAGGIKAQTQRGTFGKTWWAGRWIAALEQLVDPRRLARGRSYARSGQVVTLDVGRGGIAARVQGSRPTPYKVSIRFRPLSDAAWDRVIDAMAAEALYAARLLSGEMPEQVENVFAAAGTSLFPASGGDLVTECSCPDWANPCKHVAAVHYLLGERFDADPFLIFALRGRSQEQIAEALRARRTDEAGGEIGVVAAAEVAVDEEAPAPLPAAPGAFWILPAGVADAPTHVEAPPVDALPVKRLGVPPFWRGQRDFMAEMEGLYRVIGTHARQLLTGEDDGEGSDGRRRKT